MYIGDIYIVERNYGLIVSSFLFTTLAVVAVLMRLVTRFWLVKAFGIDDGFIALAALGTLGFTTAAVAQIRYGLGDAVDLEYLANFLQSLYATIICYSVTHFSVKFSILFQCKRIFTERRAQRLFLGLIIYLAVYCAFCLMSSIITCWPVPKYWNASIPGGCIDRSALHYGFAGINIVNDIILLVSPMPFLRTIQIARRAKFVLMGVFCCGGFACVVAIIRLHSLWVNNSAPIDQQPIKGVDIAIWSSLEINVAILCACVPALKPLFVKVFPRLISSFSDSAKRSRTGQSHSTKGNIHLRSFDKRSTMHSRSDPESGHGSNNGIEIQVQKSFETRTTPLVADDDSEKSLNPGSGPTWQTEVYTGSPGRSPHQG